MGATTLSLASGINISHPYVLLTGACIALMLTYFFKRLPQRSYLPSVILLTLTGMLIKFGLDLVNVKMDVVMPFLNVVGGIALIVVVLEASLGIQLEKEKYALIGHSLLSAILSLAATTISIAGILYWQLDLEFGHALLFSVP